MIFADSIFTYQSLMDTYQSGSILDISWPLSYILITLAGISQIVFSKTYKAENTIPMKVLLRREKINEWFSYLPYLWVIAAYILLAQYHASESVVNSNILFIGVGIIVVLVLLRQIIVLDDNKLLLAKINTTLEKVRKQASELDKTNLSLRQEIIQRNRVEEKLSHDALHDGLTGLANRLLFMDRLNHAVEFSKRDSKIGYAILFIDLDNFKSINDSMGHSAGDLALIEFSQRLSGCTRSIDTNARFGGDEFVALIENTNENITGVSVAERIIRELERPFLIKNKELFITCSIGIVQGISDYTTPEDVLRDADIAMYWAKEKGKAHSEIFYLYMRKAALSRMETEDDLRQAIANYEFYLEYQPIYSLEQNHIVGMEALVRWQHPQQGLLMPGQFIEIAEKTGLIIPLGEWVLQEACTQLKKWHIKYADMNQLSLSVNISGKQIAQSNFVDKVNSILTITGVDPHKVSLEITENTYIENQSVVNDLLGTLRKSGVNFMIDDFGTGYSSLGYLKNISVNIIKIDKSFVRDIVDGAKDLEIIKTIILMAHSLGMDTIAEGIETNEQLLVLKLLGCKYGQGFYLAKPMSPFQFEMLLENQAKWSGKLAQPSDEAALSKMN
jgi:diguanylate cyclase (GGDEF)-like protein